MAELKPALKIEEGMDRREVSYTTYQMRNPFRQFYDGVATELDVHCYIQHGYAADLLPKAGSVLDVCCGRGLLIPFLRYRGNIPRIYVGVDAEPRNARWKDGADPRRESEQKKNGCGFPTLFVEPTVDAMAEPVTQKLRMNPGPGGLVPDGTFDLIVYTSAIEHMQPAAQAASIQQCAKLAHDRTVLYLSCPVTEPGRSGYDCQYAAHIYEPTLDELRMWLHNAGWIIRRQHGLSTGTKHFRRVLDGPDLAEAESVYATLPREFALPTIAALFPRCALEVALECQRAVADADLFSGWAAGGQ